MTALPVTADTCGPCGAVHGRTDLMWTCPTHKHLLQAVPSSSDGQFERYTCPAFRCPYERSAPIKPRTPSKGDPMTTALSRPSQAVDLMWHRKTHIAAVLPEHIDVKSFIGTAAAALYADAKLMAAAEKAPESLIGALMECASLGHRPGTEEYYLTPRGNKVLGIEGYRGIVERMYRSGAVRTVIVREVCANDYFEFIEGRDDLPLHSIAGHSRTAGQSTTGADFFASGSKRGDMVGVYAYALLATGAVSRVVLLSRADVMAARDASDSKDSDYSPWNRLDAGKDHPEFRGRSMWWKTAVKRLEPWVPTSAEYRREQLRAAAQAATAPSSWSAEAVPPPLSRDLSGDLDAIPSSQIGEPAALPEPERKPSGNGAATKALQKAIKDKFTKLGIEDEAEQDSYVHLLAGDDYGTDHGLRIALQNLGACDTYEELRELVAPVEAS